MQIGEHKLNPNRETVQWRMFAWIGNRFHPFWHDFIYITHWEQSAKTCQHESKCLANISLSWFCLQCKLSTGVLEMKTNPLLISADAAFRAIIIKWMLFWWYEPTSSLMLCIISLTKLDNTFFFVWKCHRMILFFFGNSALLTIFVPLYLMRFSFNLCILSASTHTWIMWTLSREIYAPSWSLLGPLILLDNKPRTLDIRFRG